jgi:very-short-patch-repair endonuclease
MWVSEAFSLPDLAYSPADLLLRQDDVLSTSQARLLFDSGHVRQQVRLRRWQVPHHKVVVLHNGPLTRMQKFWVATFAAPVGSALWGPSAAELDGLQGFVDAQVHIAVPPGSRRIQLPWLTTHWSSHLGPQDVHPVASPARTRLPRSLVDMASSSKNDRFARAVIFAGAQQRLVVAASLADALSRRGGCRHHALIRETLADIEGGIQSVPEKDFDAIVRRFGLPKPSRQVIKRRPDGHYYLDVAWEEYGLAVEVDGGHHREARQWDDDLMRAAWIVSGGLRQIRFTSYAVRRRGDQVGNLLDRALRSGGWRP